MIYSATAQAKKEDGFTLIEVCMASLLVMVGLVFLAQLFVVAIKQNRSVKQQTAATAIAQQKMEELNALEKTDARLLTGGGLDIASKQNGYYDQVYVNDAGTVSTTIPAGQVANYKRYWKIEADPSLNRTFIISVRVVSVFISKGGRQEETTLASVRSW